MQDDTYVEEINPIDYLIVILRRRRLIIGMTLLACLFTALLSLSMTSVYKAETKILPSHQATSSTTAQILSQLGGSSGMVMGGLNIKTTNDLYVALLKSRPVLDPVIERFNLMAGYKAKSLQGARNSLLRSLKTQDDKKSGILTIAVEYKNPEKASRIANAFVEELKNLTLNLAVTEAGERRLFFEGQLKGAKDSLIKAEESFRGFQEKTGAIKIDEQARAIIDSIAHLRALIAGKEVELKVMQTYATQYNPDIQKVKEEISGLKIELSKLETKGISQSPDPLMPSGKIPAVSTEYVRKLREFKYNEAIYEILLKQYEGARLDEAKDTAVIQVIEKAIPPEKRIRPKMLSMVVTGTLIGFILSVITVFFIEYIGNISKEKIDALKKHLKI